MFRFRASVRACVADKIVRAQMQQMERIGSSGLLKVFRDVEMPVQKSLLTMELCGMAVDRSIMEKLNLRMNELMNELENEMYRMHGKTVQDHVVA